MSVRINGSELLPGVKQYYNGTHVQKIFYNGTQVYQYDDINPVITITSSTSIQYSPAYTLTGTVTDAHSGVATVWVNNTVISISDTGAFSKALTLAEGNNTITVKAQDNAGNVATSSITVRYVHSDPTRTDLLAPENEVEEHVGDYYITTKTNSAGEVYYRNYQRDKPGGAGIDETFIIAIPKGVQVVSYTATKDQGFQFPTGFTVEIIDTNTSTVLYSTTAPDATDAHHTVTSGTYIIPESITYTHNIILSTYIKGSSYAETWGGGVGGGYTQAVVNYYT